MAKILVYVGSAVIGAGLGYLVYKYIGCRSGSCPITSNPYLSIIWCILFAMVTVSMFIDKMVK